MLVISRGYVSRVTTDTTFTQEIEYSYRTYRRGVNTAFIYLKKYRRDSWALKRKLGTARPPSAFRFAFTAVSGVCTLYMCVTILPEKDESVCARLKPYSADLTPIPYTRVRGGLHALHSH